MIGELTDVNILAHADLLTELSRREKEAGIRPEPEVDLFMKVTKWFTACHAKMETYSIAKELEFIRKLSYTAGSACMLCFKACFTTFSAACTSMICVSVA
jgi:hypothetical protein